VVVGAITIGPGADARQQADLDQRFGTAAAPVGWSSVSRSAASDDRQRHAGQQVRVSVERIPLTPKPWSCLVGVDTPASDQTAEELACIAVAPGWDEKRGGVSR
jgi:hypothetical protein